LSSNSHEVILSSVIGGHCGDFNSEKESNKG